ncbi:MAG: threonine aldolase family protein, partial [Angelakisella sp.]
MKYIDLRSDTVTQPTEEMRLAMMEAVVGDDVYEDDPTVNRLQELAAEMLGKEAALFVVSGTMGNQVSIMAHTSYGDEIIVGARSHVVSHECGAPARLAGVNFAMADNPNDFVYAADIKRLTRKDDIHCPRTSLVCLENPLVCGDVVPLAVLRESYDMAKSLGLSVHMDGARIFNCALALGVSPKEIAACTDSVMFCLSKGLCAPVGSMICGTREFIARARRMRKILGGGMRQAGVLATCGIIALEKMTLRLGEDHESAKYLAAELNKIQGIEVETNRVKINMVFWK